MAARQKYAAYFDRIEKDNAEIKAYRTISREQALEALVDNKSPFPVVFSDLISTRGIRTTANSRMLDNYIPPFDATVVERVRKAGGVILGKTITREFGVGETENPYGTCAAVAHGEGILGFAADHRGDIHAGAREYGLFAYSPSYGIVSRYGVIPVASSMDRVGILAGSFAKIPVAMDMVAGQDERDGTTFPGDADFQTLEDMDLQSVRPAVINGTAGFSERLNLPMAEVLLESLPYALPAHEILSSGEFATNMERYDGIGFGYRAGEYDSVEELYKKSRTAGLGREVQKKIISGNFCLSEGKYEPYYVQAMKARTMVKEEIEKRLESHEFLLAPVDLRYTAALYLAGLPVISMPFGEVGLLITSRAFNDRRLLAFAWQIVSRLESEE
ncbi:MAG: amidase family protein [Bacillota bacterium]|nr:amidase family protein [Bacillota bacterium]